MADGRHFENSFIAISQPEITRFTIGGNICRQHQLKLSVLRIVFYGPGPFFILHNLCKFPVSDTQRTQNTRRCISSFPVTSHMDDEDGSISVTADGHYQQSSIVFLSPNLKDSLDFLRNINIPYQRSQRPPFPLLGE